MRGVTVAKQGAPFELASDLEKPTPGPKQVLVKSIFAGINPVETFQQAGGILVASWPIVLGCDASGIVVEVGEGITKLKKGDAVCGCTRLGVPGYGTFQEYFLMDENIAIRNPDNVTLEQAATVGVGTYTAGLCLIDGLGLRFPEKGEHPKHDSWVVVAGGSGTIGQFAIQLAKICGYKVIATCSPANEALVKSLGADSILDYTNPISDQLSHLSAITAGNFSRVFDCSAYSAASAFAYLTQVSHSPEKRFATVDGWSNLENPASVTKYIVELGMIGQSGVEKEAVTKKIADYVPYLELYLAEGRLKPTGVQIAGEGFEAVADAVKLCNAQGSKGGKKVVVQLQDQ